LDRAYKHHLKLHKQKLPKKEINALKDELHLAGVAECPGDLRVQQFGEAPIQEINLQDGFACDQHGIAWESDRSADDHERAEGCELMECRI
jgi:hypothetical protein